jgi:hypothetical protein
MTAVRHTVHPVAFVTLELTGRCNLTCGHCFADSGPSRPARTITVRDWGHVIGEVFSLGVRTVQFIGGEPTLQCACAHVRHGVAAGPHADVFSNLGRVTPAQRDALSLPGVSLATSWCSADLKVHAQATDRWAAQAGTKANLAEAVRRGILLRAGMVDVAGREHARAGRAELAAGAMPARSGAGRQRGSSAA